MSEEVKENVPEDSQMSKIENKGDNGDSKKLVPDEHTAINLPEEKKKEMLNLIEESVGESVENILGSVASKLSPLDSKLNKMKGNVDKFRGKYMGVVKEYGDFKTKISEWQNSVKKITKNDLLKIKKLKRTITDKDSRIDSLKKSLEQKEEDLRKQVVSEATPSLPQTFEELHPRMLKRIEFPEENLIYWAVRTKNESNKQSHIHFVEEEEIYFEDVSDKTGLSLTDEETSIQAKLNLQKAMKACRESDEQLKSYKSRAHSALKKKNEQLDSMKDEIKTLEEKLDEMESSREQETEDHKSMQKELDSKLLELVESQTTIVQLEKDKASLNTKITEQDNEIESVQEKYETFQSEKIKEIEQMESDFQTQLMSQKANWRKRMDEKEKIILELRKSGPKRKERKQEKLGENSIRKVANIENVQKSLKREDGRVKKDFEEIFALAEIQAKREREIKEKNRSINELRSKLKRFESMEKEFSKISKAYQKKSKDLKDVMTKENIPNLEYMKNITIQLLLCDEKQVRKNLLKVVAKEMKFEKSEYSKCHKKLIEGKSKGIFGF